DTIAVGAPVLEIDVAEAASAPAQSPDAAADTTEKDAYRAEERAGSGNVLIGYGTTDRAGSGRRRARAAASSASVSRAATRPTAPASGSDAAAGPPEAAPRRTVAVRSPLVRRLARDLGVDLHTVAPTGADGAITRGDVLRAAVDDAVDGAA